ncbi:hypothetical protein GCM10009753_72440 [Streptantibioticus ferralitis]
MSVTAVMKPSTTPGTKGRTAGRPVSVSVRCCALTCFLSFLPRKAHPAACGTERTEPALLLRTTNTIVAAAVLGLSSGDPHRAIGSAEQPASARAYAVSVPGPQVRDS